MNRSAADFPEGMNELAAVGLHEAASGAVLVPRVALLIVGVTLKPW